MKFILNGVEQNYKGDPKRSLLKYLREDVYITSPKDGCSPEAACGSCIVELNGKAVLSCRIPLSKVKSGEVITTEGMVERYCNSMIEFAKIRLSGFIYYVQKKHNYRVK